MDKKYFVPYETAKLLKEKGYPQDGEDYIYLSGGERKRRNWLDSYQMDILNAVICPTYHEVVDWLERKGYPIESACIREYSDSDMMWLCGIAYTTTRIYLTREEALNEAIIKALERS